MVLTSFSTHCVESVRCRDWFEFAVSGIEVDPEVICLAPAVPVPFRAAVGGCQTVLMPGRNRAISEWVQYRVPLWNV